MSATSHEEGTLSRETNWWGAFVIGLAGTILIIGLVGYALVSLGGAAIVTSSARGRQGATAGTHVAGERSSAAMRAACVMPKSRRGATSAAVETESASIVAARSIPLGGELSPWSHGIDPKL